MNMQKTATGFMLSRDAVSYVFDSEATPVLQNDVCVLHVSGNIPVPKLEATDRLILPVDEGIAVEVGRTYTKGELDINCIDGSFMGRQGTMSMLLVERQKQFLLICLENGLDAAYRAVREEGMYRLSVTCKTPRNIFYGVFSSLAQACRAYKKMKGISTLTLADKKKRLPLIDKLMGGIFWIWNDHYDEVMYADHDVDISPAVGDDLLTVCADMKKSGIDNAMIALFFDPDSQYTKALYEDFGYITTQYDNYNDVLNPALLSVVPNNRVKNCGYTNRRLKDYPDGIMRDAQGRMARAWELKGFDGQMHAQNTLCPKVAAERMKTEIQEILQEYPHYKGRFIDVYGGWISECHDEAHPLTKQECLRVKQDAFRFLGELGLIAGTEDGFEDLVDSLVYAEGLHSPVYLRNHDSGRKHANMYTEERAAHIKAQMLDPSCRVPLWQLVYHDSLLAFPYWGDSTEASHSIINEKILYACLFGCPPLYSFFVKDYEGLKADILKSYRKIGAVLRHTAMLPMTDYQVLREDYTLQRTVFGDEYEVVANFSDEQREYQGHCIAPMDLYVGRMA